MRDAARLGKRRASTGAGQGFQACAASTRIKRTQGEQELRVVELIHRVAWIGQRSADCGPLLVGIGGLGQIRRDVLTTLEESSATFWATSTDLVGSVDPVPELTTLLRFRPIHISRDAAMH